MGIHRPSHFVIGHPFIIDEELLSHHRLMSVGRDEKTQANLRLEPERAPMTCLSGFAYVRLYVSKEHGPPKIHHLSNVQSQSGRQMFHANVSMSETNGNAHGHTPLDPDSGPRSSQTKTEPGRIKSRRSTFVSRLVMRGRIRWATAWKIMLLSRVFLMRTSVNVGPWTISGGFWVRGMWRRRRKRAGGALIYGRL